MFHCRWKRSFATFLFYKVEYIDCFDPLNLYYVRYKSESAKHARPFYWMHASLLVAMQSQLDRTVPIFCVWPHPQTDPDLWRNSLRSHNEYDSRNPCLCHRYIVVSGVSQHREAICLLWTTLTRKLTSVLRLWITFNISYWILSNKYCSIMCSKFALRQRNESGNL